MKKLIYTLIALSFVVTAQTAHAGAACGASSAVSREAKTKYNVASLVGQSSSKSVRVVKKTKTTK